MSTNLSCGIVGLPNVGKSTLFNALTKKGVPAENYPFCTIDPSVGVVEVFDQRLEYLAKQSKSKKVIYATVAFVDIAGLVKGASKGEGLGNQFLTHIRDTDAIVQVVRCFEEENITHVAETIDPVRDVEIINLELILADIQLADNVFSKLQKQAKGNKTFDDILLLFSKKILPHLNNQKMLRFLSLTSEERVFLSQYPFLTSKRVIYIANVKEDDILTGNKYVEQLREYANKEHANVIVLSAKLEEELAHLSKEEALQFLKSLGLQTSGLDLLIKEAFSMLDLITFITTGELETKAWTIKKGTSAMQAAGKIHTDIEKGFIKAEVVTFEDMCTYNGRVGARDVGKARFEGKEYEVKDGDVILFFHKQ